MRVMLHLCVLRISLGTWPALPLTIQAPGATASTSTSLSLSLCHFTSLRSHFFLFPQTCPQIHFTFFPFFFPCFSSFLFFSFLFLLFLPFLFFFYRPIPLANWKPSPASWPLFPPPFYFHLNSFFLPRETWVIKPFILRFIPIFHILSLSFFLSLPTIDHPIAVPSMVTRLVTAVICPSWTFSASSVPSFYPSCQLLFCSTTCSNHPIGDYQ